MDEREVVPNDVFNTALQTAENEKKYWTVGLEPVHMCWNALTHQSRIWLENMRFILKLRIWM